MKKTHQCELYEVGREIFMTVFTSYTFWFSLFVFGSACLCLIYAVCVWIVLFGWVLFLHFLWLHTGNGGFV